MPYTSFHEKFLKLAQQETRTITTLSSHPTLPEDDYGLIEMYCDEPGCDCRRVMIEVYSWRKKQPLAYIAYGWESRQFYIQWFGNNNPNIIKELQGPALNSASPQSKLAPDLLKEVSLALQDKQYVDRLKRHYVIFRKAIEKRAKRSL